ncbi:MAG TPA: methylmalonyl-CoA mutase small subunit [Bacteroidales bacterium]|nr:methylmalonyl-CoA mutase small subunit [Bacteroidales bacterium]
MPEKEKLLNQFLPISTEEWLDKVKTDLKGQDFDRKLVWKTLEGFSVNPFYRAEDIASIPHIDNPPGEYPFLRGVHPGRNEWYIRQDIDVNDPVEANKKALIILDRGVNSLGFIFNENVNYTPALIKSLLKGIYCESIEINFLTQGNAKDLFEVFNNYLGEKRIKSNCVKGGIEADPLGRLMVNGKLCTTVKDSFDYVADLVKSAEHLERFRVLNINGSAFGNAGSGIVKELAYSLSMGNEYLAQLTDRGVNTDNAARSMGFTFSIGSNYFMEIARMRAARVLWARVVDAYSPVSEEACKIYIHSVTGDWNKTIYDPYVNMLRTQTEAMSATLGGTDSLTVRPFDSVFREPSEFSERIARNQQLLLMEESHFDKVNDPSAGSYYIEKLTASIAEHAWSLFVETEKEGGFLAGLMNGSIQAGVKETAEKRKTNIRRRKEKLLGTNIFPNEKDRVSTSYKKHGEKKDESYEIEPLQAFRAAEEFENIRMAVDSMENTPVVFLLTIGNPVMSKVRAQFTKGFFGCVGYKVIDNIGFTDPASGVSAAVKAKADIVVVCSSDDEYAEYVPEINKLLGEKSMLVVAGEPDCMDDLRKKGVDHFISLRSNLLETLMEYNRQLGIN